MKVICRKCGSNKINRIHRGFLARLLTFFTDPFMRIRRYECLNCGWRGLRRKDD